MFVVLRKKSVIICLVFVCAVILSCVMLSYAAGAEVASVPKIGKTVVVDAGHGGIDGGVVGSTSGVKESEINPGDSQKPQAFSGEKRLRRGNDARKQRRALRAYV